MQNLSPPSFFLTSTTALGHELKLLLIAPTLQHLLEVSFHLLIEVAWYSPIPTLAQIQIILGEDISRVNQKIFGCLLLICCPSI